MDVTEAMLAQTEEGVEGWACRGLDTKARGPIGNALYRQLKKSPEMTEAYRWLFDDLKRRFRETWAVHRNFEFVRRKRVKSLATKTKQEEIGTWKNELQLQVHFGGTDQPEAQRQAANYILRCRGFKDLQLVDTLISAIPNRF